MIKQGIEVSRLLWHVSGTERRKEGREGRKKERGKKERERVGGLSLTKRDLRDIIARCDVLNLLGPYSHKSIIKSFLNYWRHLFMEQKLSKKVFN